MISGNATSGPEQLSVLPVNREVRRNRKVGWLSDRIARVAFQVPLVLWLTLPASHFVALTDLFGGSLPAANGLSFAVGVAASAS